MRRISVRLHFAISAQLGLIIHQMDVDSTFIYADIQEEIYVKPPEALHYQKE